MAFRTPKPHLLTIMPCMLRNLFSQEGHFWGPDEWMGVEHHITSQLGKGRRLDVRISLAFLLISHKRGILSLRQGNKPQIDLGRTKQQCRWWKVKARSEDKLEDRLGVRFGVALFFFLLHCTAHW